MLRGGRAARGTPGGEVAGLPKTLFVLGAGSLVGSELARQAAAAGVRVEAAGRTDPRPAGVPLAAFSRLDLADEPSVRSFASRRERDTAWINFAARTDVDGCEKERTEGPPAPAAVDRADSAWRINAEFPGWLAEEADRRGTPLVHISTDFVFDGTQGPYSETDRPSPLSPRLGWYGYTKGQGEERVRAARGPTTVLRLSYPYGGAAGGKADFARTLVSRARAGELYPLYTDQQITPTWIPDVARAVLRIVEGDARGTVHVASPEITTPFEFGRWAIEAFGLPIETVRGARLAEMTAGSGRAPRPLRGGLKLERIRSLGVRPLPPRVALSRWAERERAVRPA